MTRPEADGWARCGKGLLWHRVAYYPASKYAWFICMGRGAKVEPSDCMDYRWRPPSHMGCCNPFCMEDFEP